MWSASYIFLLPRKGNIGMPTAACIFSTQKKAFWLFLPKHKSTHPNAFCNLQKKHWEFSATGVQLESTGPVSLLVLSQKSSFSTACVMLRRARRKDGREPKKSRVATWRHKVATGPRITRARLARSNVASDAHAFSCASTFACFSAVLAAMACLKSCWPSRRPRIRDALTKNASKL